MDKKQRTRRPTRRELDRLQIEEYIATNRHGPGNHSFEIRLKMSRSNKPLVENP
jgi:hypothetical protein